MIVRGRTVLAAEQCPQLGPNGVANLAARWPNRSRSVAPPRRATSYQATASSVGRTAASSEELAATAEQMSAQTAQLKHLMDFFVTGADGWAATTVAPAEPTGSWPSWYTESYLRTRRDTGLYNDNRVAAASTGAEADIESKFQRF
jgi:hypothetical protein